VVIPTVDSLSVVLRIKSRNASLLLSISMRSFRRMGDSVFTLSSEAFQLYAIKMAAQLGGIACVTVPAASFALNEQDRAWFDEKITPHPLASMLEGVRLKGDHLKVKKRMFIMAIWVTEFPSPFRQFYDRLKDDPAWVIHTIESGHDVMLNDPQAFVKISPGGSRLSLCAHRQACSCKRRVSVCRLIPQRPGLRYHFRCGSDALRSISKMISTSVPGCVKRTALRMTFFTRASKRMWIGIQENDPTPFVRRLTDLPDDCASKLLSAAVSSTSCVKSTYSLSADRKARLQGVRASKVALSGDQFSQHHGPDR